MYYKSGGSRTAIAIARNLDRASTMTDRGKQRDFGLPRYQDNYFYLYVPTHWLLSDERKKGVEPQP